MIGLAIETQIILLQTPKNTENQTIFDGLYGDIEV